MTETILPHELPDALERAPDDVKVLSLDCFDTLLWRDCHAPSDVFAELNAVLPRQRMAGEANARKAETTLRKRNEVALPAIYAHAMEGADRADRETAMIAELAAEARACFAFEPTVELIRAAKARGLKVIIVSDTYLTARQLGQLIAEAAGEEVAALIDTIVVSSEAGISKNQGLLGRGLKVMRCRSHEILHIGDNPKADYEAARALGIPALHLVQFGDAAKQRLRMERACQQIAGETARGIRGLQLHRAILARDEPSIEHPATALGYTVLGPVFHAYEQWLRSEAASLEAERGGKVHWLFLLRDGHLPHLVHQVAGDAESTARVEISRFVATAASLTTREAYEKHVALEHGLNPSTLARQMLLTDDEIAGAIGEPESDTERAEAAHRLLDELRKGQRQKLTRRRARAFADRLIAHVRAAVDPQPGDTLMLVDLGYNGSAQNRIDALLSETFDVHVAGRYLLLREMTASGLDKKGLIDPRHFAPDFLEALCANVAVIEQLATCELGSVVDYTDEGEPIRNESSVKGKQSAVRTLVQAGAEHFAEAALDPPVIRVEDCHRERGWRETAASVLARFMFLPQPHELEVVKSFEHDVNMGSERMVPLFDPGRGREGMQRRGLFYMKGSSRMYLPAELAAEDLSTRLSLLVQMRFGLGLTYDDFSTRKVEVPTLYVGARDGAQTTVVATPTHDGYFAARLPLGDASHAIAIQLGAVCEWVEISSVTRSLVKSLKGGAQNDDLPEPVAVHFDAMKEHAPGIFECQGDNALVLVPHGAVPSGDQPHMVEVVFRPLRMRAAEQVRPRGMAESALSRLGSAAA
ncbi:MAG: HAD family hydrolase [Erythrobacter sp.]|nr:HAD family hydrolase [Erythrobacter sp.]